MYTGCKKKIRSVTESEAAYIYEKVNYTGIMPKNIIYYRVVVAKLDIKKTVS